MRINLPTKICIALLFISPGLCRGQESEKTRVVILDPFEVTSAPELEALATVYVSRARAFTDSLDARIGSGRVSPEALGTVKRLQTYRSNLDLGSAFSQFLVIRFLSEAENRRDENDLTSCR